MLFLQSNEVSTSHATKIYKTYGKESISIVKENPYRLADDIWGIDLKQQIPLRRKWALIRRNLYVCAVVFFYTLNKLGEEGHCYGEREQLVKKAKELLEVEEGGLKLL